MGLFNPNYDKPGAGVRKNEPKKKGAALFWELFSRKWRDYILVNLLYCATCIPAFIFYFFMAVGLMPGEPTPEGMAQSVMIAAFMVLFFAGSPFKSGFIYVIRNYVREEHAWPVSDFFKKTWENIGQSLMVFIIDLVASTAFMFAIRFYAAASETTTIMTIFLCVVIVVMVMYAIMQSFVWSMMVTFELKIPAIYKNSFLLSMATIPVNIISIAIRVFATALLFFANYLAYIVIIAVFFSANALLEQVLAFPTIEKFMFVKSDNDEQVEEYNELEELEETSVEEDDD